MNARLSAWTIFLSQALGPGQQTTCWWAPATWMFFHVADQKQHSSLGTSQDVSAPSSPLAQTT